MNSRLVFVAYRAGLASFVLVAVLTQMADLLARQVLVPLNFFSYFTIQSNLIGAAVFFVAAANWRSGRSRTFELIRGAAVVYLAVTFVVFALLLSGTNVDTAIPWVNAVLHQVFPLVVIADWLIDPPRWAISVRQSLVWLAYPLGWTAYTLVRGAMVGWYPYPFLNPANGGYGTVAVYVVAILAFGTAICAAVAWVGGLLRTGWGRLAPDGPR
jgi:hypothetical protein